MNQKDYRQKNSENVLPNDHTDEFVKTLVKCRLIIDTS